MTVHSNLGEAKKQADRNILAAKADNFKQVSAPAKVEWAQIAPDKVIIATEDRTWLCNSNSLKGDRFTKPMECAGSIPTTRKLLDGAIAAAKYGVNSNVRPPALTTTRLVWRLAGAYHLTHAYPPLIEEAALGFAAAKRWNLAEWAFQKAKEEKGHDRLALRDIQSMGYDAQAVVKTLVPPAAVTLTDYSTRSAQDDDPIDCVGYSYTLERLSTGIVDEKYIQKVKGLLPPKTHATRCLRAHSSVGEDAEHVEETVEMVAKLTAKERVRVARACYETALLCFSPPRESYISDKKLQQILKPLKLEKSL